MPPRGARYPRRVRIWRSLDDVPGDLGRTSVVIGNFDGVHLGHQHVIAEARRLADAEGLRVVAVTFDPHPMAVLRPEHAPTTLTDLETRAALLGDCGVDDVLALPFDREIAAWTPAGVREPGARRQPARGGGRGRRELPLRHQGLRRRGHADGQRRGARVPSGRRTPGRRAAGLVVDVRPHLPGRR